MRRQAPLEATEVRLATSDRRRKGGRQRSFGLRPLRQQLYQKLERINGSATFGQEGGQTAILQGAVQVPGVSNKNSLYLRTQCRQPADKRSNTHLHDRGFVTHAVVGCTCVQRVEDDTPACRLSILCMPVGDRTSQPSSDRPCPTLGGESDRHMEQLLPWPR